jgi:hypothetical protein
MTERFKVPHSYADEAEHIAITARLRPLAESETVKMVTLTFWVEGMDRPLGQYTLSSQALFTWSRLIPPEATHLTIEGD